MRSPCVITSAPALLHPAVLIFQVSAAIVATESTPAGVGCPQAVDEVGQIAGEDD